MSAPTPLAEPVERIPGDPLEDAPEAGTALCLSGGGYRAMLFHLGALWRLNEGGFLPRLDRVSSVSGGSIAAGVLGHRWSKLDFQDSVARSFVAQVVAPIRALAGETIDLTSIGKGILLPGSAADYVAGAYREHLFGEATLQDLPERPRFVVNASNVQTGALWRFSRPYMGDWRVGLVREPVLSLALAIAASSAFPPVLSPLRLELPRGVVERVPGADLHDEPYTTKVVLSDGGVYDNLGLETAWKRYRTILVSDGGGRLKPQPEPAGDWARHSVRVLQLFDQQVRNLRTRQLLGSYRSGARNGAYWSIRTPLGDYGLFDCLDCPPGATAELAAVDTRLARLAPGMQERLINWGYAVCDTALRRHVNPALPKGSFPYAGGV